MLAVQGRLCAFFGCFVPLSHCRSRAGTQRSLDSLSSEKELLKQLTLSSTTAAALLARKALVMLLLASRGRHGACTCTSLKPAAAPLPSTIPDAHVFVRVND